jgi:chemotaxis protein MotB
MTRMTTTNRLSRSILFVGLLGVTALFAGCEGGPKLEEERNQLYAQNREAQEELNRTRQALEALTNERNLLAAENARLAGENDATRAELAKAETNLKVAEAALAEATKKPVPVRVVEPTPAKTPFSDIENTEITTGPGVITIKVPGDVLFEAGKIDLKSSSKTTLEKIANVLKKDYAGKTIRVEGYTDTDPISKSKWTDNLDLSLERAAAVHRFLQSKGLPGNRMYAAGFGEFRPRSSKATSRRVEIVVLLNEAQAAGK